MPAGFRRRGDHESLDRFFSVGLSVTAQLDRGKPKTQSVRGDFLRRPRVQVIGAPLVKLLLRITHGFRLAAAEHDLEVDGLQAVVLVAVNDAGRAGDALPGSEARGEAATAFPPPPQPP